MPNQLVLPILSYSASPFKFRQAKLASRNKLVLRIKKSVFPKHCQLNSVSLFHFIILNTSFLWKCDLEEFERTGVAELANHKYKLGPKDKLSLLYKSSGQKSLFQKRYSSEHIPIRKKRMIMLSLPAAVKTILKVNMQETVIESLENITQRITTNQNMTMDMTV